MRFHFILNQIPRCKQRGIKLATPQSRKRPSDTLVFDPRGIRQLAVQARPLDSLLAGINSIIPRKENPDYKKGA